MFGIEHPLKVGKAQQYPRAIAEPIDQHMDTTTDIGVCYARPGQYFVK